MSEIILQTNKNAPLFVPGSLTFIDDEGNKSEMKDGSIFLCRCGGSKRKPFCDGSHKNNGFEGPQFKLVRE